MEITPLVIRLEELTKSTDLENYILFRDFFMSQGDFFRTESADEFDNIEKELRNDLLTDIENRSSKVFENFNVKDFDLFEISNQLHSLTLEHWQSRNELEIKRDKLLHLNYTFYSNQYFQVTKYKEIQNIEANRKQLKETIKAQMIATFERVLVQELNENKIQETLRNQSHHYYPFLTDKAKEYYSRRKSEEIERDAFGYISIETYEECLAISLRQAIDFIQSSSKAENIELYIKFLRGKINEVTEDEYPGIIDYDLSDYITELYKTRNEKKIADDTIKLIDLPTYLKWRHFALTQIENEFPNMFAEEEDFYDDYETDDSPDPRYEKYGGYNGYDDDTIDNAFEGDPSNTWNVE